MAGGTIARGRGVRAGRILALLSIIVALTGCSVDWLTIGESRPVFISDLTIQIPEEGAGRYRDSFVEEGLKQLGEGDIESSSAAFNRALKYEPQNSYLHFLNALAYHLLAARGDASEFDYAEVGYQLALQFDPTNQWAAYFYGVLDIERRRYRAAQERFAQALLVDDANGAALHGLAVASYYLGDLEMARQAIARAERAAAGKPPILRTAALVAAALNEPERARAYAAAYEAAKPKGARSAHLSRRIADWAHFHARVAATTETAADGAAAAAPQTRAPAPPTAAERQVVVDVVIIRSEETLRSGKGVNLLNGLQLQFGYSRTDNETALNKIAGATAASNSTATFNPFPFEQVITRTLSIPTVTYSLNIFNTQGDRNEVIARPSLLALEGKPSKFFSGAELTVGFVGREGGNFDSREIGVTLEVTPTFRDDGRIEIAVTAERDFFEPTAPGTFVERVQTSKNRVSANAVLRFGETLILSGLSEKESENLDNRTPLLGDIPGLQYLFSREDTADTTKSVLILLTPRRPAPVGEMAAGVRPDAPPPNVEELNRAWRSGYRPAPNLEATIFPLHRRAFFRQFRAGDVAIERWPAPDRLSRAVDRAVQFLYY
jgi:general secretion pathway protein D